MWRRFQDAEAMPDPDVWSRIDHALTMQENARYKKRVLFYRQLAAACFTLFILAGSALLLHFKHDQEQAQLAAATSAQATPANNTATIANNSNNPAIASPATQETATGSQNIVGAATGNGTLLENDQAPALTPDKVPVIVAWLLSVVAAAIKLSDVAIVVASLVTSFLPEP